MKYEKALDQGWIDLEIAYPGKTKFIICFLNKNYILDLKDKIVRDLDYNNADTEISVLLMHFLVKMKSFVPRPNSGKIGFRNLPGGDVYYDVFYKRVLQKLAELYSKKKPEFVRALEDKLCCSVIASGDFGYRATIFPEVQVDIVLWDSDEEFDAECNILFYDYIKDLMDTEDVIVACEVIVSRIKQVIGENQAGTPD